MANRKTWSVKKELLEKAKESALAAVKIFNDPLMTFKSEGFIVLMIIAWTYLLHAYYKSNKIDYRYFKKVKTRKSYDRTKRGSFKYWELERCLDDNSCPIDKDAKNNLKFLIGLRHEIEHQMSFNIDNYLSGRYQACILNFNYYLKQLFGESHGLDSSLTFSLQFIEFSDEQVQGAKPEVLIPYGIKAYIVEFEATLSENEFNSPKFSYRLLFNRKLANRKGQADKVVEFIDSKSELAKTINKQYWVVKKGEQEKFLPSHVIKKVQEAGFANFKMQRHTDMWKQEEAKNPQKGFGVMVEGTWYWYQTWINKCIELCTLAGDVYKAKNN